MRAENIGIWNKQHFFCGAFDTTSLKVVEVHKYEECEAVDFNSYFVFNRVIDSVKAEELLESYTWIFFWLDKRGNTIEVNTMYETDNQQLTNLQKLQIEGVKSLIRKQISIDPKMVGTNVKWA